MRGYKFLSGNPANVIILADIHAILRRMEYAVTRWK